MKFERASQLCMQRKVGWQTRYTLKVQAEHLTMHASSLPSPFSLMYLPICYVTADDDYAAAVLSKTLNKPSNITDFLMNRAMNAPFTLFNNDTGFMEARNSDGSWAGESLLFTLVS
jgi:hypothetical protein